MQLALTTGPDSIASPRAPALVSHSPGNHPAASCASRSGAGRSGRGAYDAAHAGADQWALELAWLRRAVDVLGHKEVAYKLDVQPSQLTDALLERERKDIKAKWFATVLRMPGLPEEMRAEWLRLACESLGYEAPKRKRTMTPEEELRELRRVLKEQAPMVLALAEKEMGK